MEEQKGKKEKGLAVFLLLLLVAAVAAGAFFCWNYKKVFKQYQDLEKNKNQIVENEVESRLTEERAEERAEVMDTFREGLGKETNTLSFLREIYGENYLVYQQSSNYLFRPLLDVEMADYTDGEFGKDETSGLRYFEKDGERKTKHIIDVSKYQGEIDWKAVKQAGIEGVMIRVGIRGYGSGEIVADANFEANIKGAKDQGLDTGVYFFSEAVDKKEAEEEAEFVLNAVKDYKLELPVAFDLEEITGDTGRNETLSKDDMTDVTLAFFEKIEDAGYEPMLYGNIDTISDMIDLTRLEKYKLWFAYYSKEIYIPYKVDMWQYASDGKVDGISTECDVNMMFTE